ncbi:hypothetical protein ACFCXT_23320 [Streptomyces vinaceus]|uniref:hypothetical protein n=1 Tax=Streptomyces vinaceus TaxID=1960 RepID=UPI0035D90753
MAKEKGPKSGSLLSLRMGEEGTPDAQLCMSRRVLADLLDRGRVTVVASDVVLEGVPHQNQAFRYLVIDAV